MTHALRTFAVFSAVTLLAALPLGRPADAQISPGDTGAGTKLGMQALSGSGQVGEVTLFDAGAETRLQIRIDGSGGRKELARVARGKACDRFDLTQGFSLAPLANGFSRTLVHAPSSRLLSGNYVAVVMSSGLHGKPVACGYLHT